LYGGRKLARQDQVAAAQRCLTYPRIKVICSYDKGTQTRTEADAGARPAAEPRAIESYGRRNEARPCGPRAGDGFYLAPRIDLGGYQDDEVTKRPGRVCHHATGPNRKERVCASPIS
jgi:hypothetical protein